MLLSIKNADSDINDIAESGNGLKVHAEECARKGKRIHTDAHSISAPAMPLSRLAAKQRRRA
jgi:hypothetical protein